MHNDKKIIIEFVCTGNNARSPMAEVIGNNYATDIGLENLLSFISSGTRVDTEYESFFSYERATLILNKASSHGLLKEIHVDKDRYENDNNYNSAIKNDIIMALRIMRPIEVALRDAALYNINMKYDGAQTQTIARDDVSIILGMEKEHVRQVEKIYSAKGMATNNMPQITTIADYTGIDGEISDCIGNTNPTAYFKMRDSLQEIIPKVIDRIKKEALIL